jgi:glycosyltransferase involved in cell wall biosynthesis
MRRDIGARAAERAQHFSWDRVAQRVLTYYERLAFERGYVPLDAPKTVEA